MSNNFKLSAIVVALATVSGSAIAAPTPVTNLKNDTTYGWYQRLLGQTETVNSSNFNPIAEKGRTETNTKTVDNTTPVSQAGTVGPASIVWLDLDGDGTKEAYLQKALADERFAGSTQTTNQSVINFDIPAGQESSVASKRTLTNNRSDVSGTAVNTGVILQQLQTAVIGGNTVVVDVAGAATTDPAQAVKVGAEFRSDDTNVAFTADDLTKKGGATNVVRNRTQTWTNYQSTQALDNTYEESQVNVNETNAKKYDTNGKQTVTGGTADFIKTGDHKNNTTTVIKNYRSGQSELANTFDTTLDQDRTNANYRFVTNALGQFLDANGVVTTDPNKYVLALVGKDAAGKSYDVEGAEFGFASDISNISARTETRTISTKNYQPNQTKVSEFDDVRERNWTRTDVFDGGVSTDQRKSEVHNVDYGNAKNTLDFDNKSKTSYVTKSRAFEENAADGSLVLKNGKPVLKSETNTDGNAENNLAQFEASEYTSGTAKDTDTVFRKRAVGGAEGTGASTRFTDNAIASSVNNSENNVTRKDAVDGFVAHNNNKTVDTANYARGLQENIEVARDLVNNTKTDVRDIQRNYTYATTTSDDVVFKDVKLKIDGSKITTADVREWVEVDTEGKETKKYYVVLGTDLDGREIREEVGYTPGTSSNQTANIITQTIRTSDETEKVHAAGGNTFYDQVQTVSGNFTEIVEGAAVGERTSGSLTSKTTLFTEKNADLAHQLVVSGAWDNQVAYERDIANNIILKDGKPVVENVRNNKGTISTTTNLYKDGQAKTQEVIFTSTRDNKVSDAAGNVLSTDIGHNNNTTVNYAKGQELARTTVGDAANEITVKSSEENAGLVGGFLDGRTQGAFNYDGTAKASIGSDTLRLDGTVDAGLAVSNAKAGIVDVGFKNNTTNTLNDKVYQDGGAKALERATVNTNETVLTYADNTTGKIVDNDSLSVTLFNKGKADKYREAVKTTTTEKTGKNYQADEDGDVILVNGKPVEIGTVSQKASTNTTENLYQIGQERFKDSVTTTNAANSMTNLDGSSKSTAIDGTTTNIVYRAGQKDGKSGENTFVAKTVSKNTETDGTVNDRTENTNNAKVEFAKGEFVAKITDAYDDARKVTLANGTVADNYSYAKTTTTNDYRNGEADRTLLADHELDSVETTKRAESRTTVDAEGKTVARSIERNNTTTVRSDESAKTENVGKSVDTVAGVTAQIDDSQIDTVNKFGNYEATVRSNTVTTTQEDGSSTSTNKTRTDSVNGVELTAKQVVTDKVGKATTVEKGTSVTAGTVATDRVQAPQIVLADRNQQVDANGSIVKEQIKATAATANRLTGQYKVGNDTVYSLRVFKDGKEVTEYFTKNANGQFQAFTGDVKSIEDGSNAPVAGGTTANTDSIETVGKVTNVITDKNVSYGEEVATRGVTTVKGSLNNSEQLQAVVGTTETTVTKQSVTTGIIGQTKDGANVYGVDVVKDNQKTTVTASGLETTGTVKAATVDASTINAGKVILANNGTVAEGSKEAVSGGQLHTLQTNVTKEITEFKGNVNNTINEFKADVNSRVNSLNSRVDDVQKTAYRGIAIALAAQQAVPNIGPGQVAVFGGVGHYEGETAGSIGVVTSFTDRISASGAFGFASGNEFGGRVGVAYVFGGK